MREDVWRKLSDGYYVRGAAAIWAGTRHWYVYTVAWPTHGPPIITHAPAGYLTMKAAQRAARAL